MKSGNLNFLEPSEPLQACNGTDLPFTLPFILLWNAEAGSIGYPRDIIKCMCFLKWQGEHKRPCSRNPIFPIRIVHKAAFSNTLHSLPFNPHAVWGNSLCLPIPIPSPWLVKLFRLNFVFYIHGTVHRNSILIRSNKMQQYTGIYLLQNHSLYMFRVSKAHIIRRT